MTLPDEPAHVLVVGEALVDVVRRGGDDEVHPGGSPLNVAVGLQRLDLPTTLHSSFGIDVHGAVIAAHLAASGVTVTPSTIHDRATSVALATIDSDGAASYTFSIDWDPAPLDVAAETVDALHIGSIGAALEPGATVVEQLLGELQRTATISFDPNIRPQLLTSAESARPRVERVVALADIVKASDEDLAWLYPDATVDQVMTRWLALGTALVVITRGADGADALAASGHVHVSAPATEVADTIGAGDSFMAGLLAAVNALGLLGGGQRPMLRAIPARRCRTGGAVRRPLCCHHGVAPGCRPAEA